jgi:hypothetical protein
VGGIFHTNHHIWATLVIAFRLWRNRIVVNIGEDLLLLSIHQAESPYIANVDMDVVVIPSATPMVLAYIVLLGDGCPAIGTLDTKATANSRSESGAVDARRESVDIPRS